MSTKDFDDESAKFEEKLEFLIRTHENGIPKIEDKEIYWPNRKKVSRMQRKTFKLTSR